ncbi:MAG: TetR/AcrR family transcriptional regulator [Actinomycetota bacterium]
MPQVAGSEDRRAQIVAAALRVLAREGLAGATTRRIAAEAGVNVATLNYHFGGKDELLASVLEETTRMFATAVRRAIRTDSGLRAALEHGLAALWQVVEATPDLQLLQYELTAYALRHRGSEWLARQQYESYRGVTEALLTEACREAGESCAIPVGELASILLAGLDGLIIQFVVDRDSARAAGGLRRLTEAVTTLADPQPAPRQEAAS